MIGEGKVTISQSIIVLFVMALSGWAGSHIEESSNANTRQDAVTQEHTENVAHLIVERDREMDAMKNDIRDLRADIRELGKSCGK